MWLLAAGLAALALASPSERLAGVGPEWLGAAQRGDTPWAAAPWLALVRTIAAALGLGLEPAAFVTGAVAYGACLPLTWRLGTRMGLGAGVALVAALMVLLSPLGCDLARRPGPEILGLLGACGLFGVVARSGAERWGARRVGLALAWTLVAAGGSLDGVALLAAAWWARWRPTRGTAEEAGGASAFRAVGGVALALLLVGRPGLGEPGGLPTWPQSPADLVTWALGMGLVWGALVAAAVREGHESEAPLPRWLWVWAAAPALVGLVVSAATRQPRPLALAHLVPLAALGWMDVFARRAGERLGSFLAAGLLGACALTALGLGPLERHDPLRAWRAHARQVLEPGDLIVTDAPEHAYLATVRWGLESVSLQRGDEAQGVMRAVAARAAGRRVVLDVAGGRTPAGLSGYLHLDELEALPTATP
ncbi:MAG: hypothetical protein H6828_03395 [Planctomycetes bacterium]|nr:hypothetical protein [Planctomycetota bacterium]